MFYYPPPQCAWRGYYVRRYIRTRAIAEAHARLEAATAALTENKRLRSRVNRVLEVLLKGKYLSQIVEALHKLGESVVCVVLQLFVALFSCLRSTLTLLCECSVLPNVTTHHMTDSS